MKPILFSIVISVSFFLASPALAQTDPWSDEAIQQNADAMYQELMKKYSNEAIQQNADAMQEQVMEQVQETYDRTYAEGMAAYEKIMADAEIYRQKLEQELLAKYGNTIQNVYEQAMSELNNTANPDKLYEEIYNRMLTRATEKYVEASIAGGSNPNASANSALEALRSASQASSFSHNLVKDIQMNWPTGDGSYWVKRRY
ncbi:MAG: hypothetical protein SF052_09420 [Bacteroidia bacterium]|nr:hypothetical protein [Bacteroidia bacterium]